VSVKAHKRQGEESKAAKFGFIPHENMARTYNDNMRLGSQFTDQRP
jgi:hypothetical protein